MTVAIRVNGEPRRLGRATTVALLVDELVSTSRGIAVAVNGEVVPRSDWDGRPLSDGDRVEVLTAAQGG